MRLLQSWMSPHPKVWVFLLASLDVIEIVLEYALSVACHIPTAIEWQAGLGCNRVLPLPESRVYIILQIGAPISTVRSSHGLLSCTNTITRALVARCTAVCSSCII